MFSRVYLLIIAPKMQYIVFYASFSMSYVFLYLIGLAQVISFLFYNLSSSQLFLIGGCIRLQLGVFNGIAKVNDHADG